MSPLETRRSVWNVLGNIDEFQTPGGLFKTFRMDYSPESCPNDRIEEERAIPIETRYDHAFITEIFMRLRNRFPERYNFDSFSRKSAAIIKNSAIVVRAGKIETLQWRHYDMPHKDNSLILPDIDNTGRCLSALLRYDEESLDSELEKEITAITSNPDNFIQMGRALWSLGPSFRPTVQFDCNANMYALMTHFGEKQNNDIDPVCNIAAILPVIEYIERSKDNTGFGFVRKVFEYLEAFINSDYAASEAFEYYEPPVLFYAYAKLMEAAARSKISGMNMQKIKRRVTGLLTERIENIGWVNSFEAGLMTASLAILRHNGRKTGKGLRFILENKKPAYWDAYRFYRQRHPYRIFGSKGLTTAVCLEALDYCEKNGYAA